MSAKLDQALDALATMSSARLREEWSRRMQTACPSFGPDLLRHALGFHIQEAANKRDVGQASRSLKAVTGRAAPSLKPGTRLLRTWNGREISVVVTDRGFEFEARNWPSLSAIARHITGTTWSGPRFFGLTGGNADG